MPTLEGSKALRELGAANGRIVNSTVLGKRSPDVLTQTPAVAVHGMCLQQTLRSGEDPLPGVRLHTERAVADLSL